VNDDVLRNLTCVGNETSKVAQANTRDCPPDRVLDLHLLALLVRDGARRLAAVAEIDQLAALDVQRLVAEWPASLSRRGGQRAEGYLLQQAQLAALEREGTQAVGRHLRRPTHRHSVRGRAHKEALTEATSSWPTSSWLRSASCKQAHTLASTRRSNSLARHSPCGTAARRCSARAAPARPRRRTSPCPASSAAQTADSRCRSGRALRNQANSPPVTQAALKWSLGRICTCRSLLDQDILSRSVSEVRIQSTRLLASSRIRTLQQRKHAPVGWRTTAHQPLHRHVNVALASQQVPDPAQHSRQRRVAGQHEIKQELVALEHRADNEASFDRQP